jgi:hypothetical protein
LSGNAAVLTVPGRDREALFRRTEAVAQDVGAERGTEARELTPLTPLTDQESWGIRLIVLAGGDIAMPLSERMRFAAVAPERRVMPDPGSVMRQPPSML